MGYVGGKLQSMFEPSMTARAAHKMAAAGGKTMTEITAAGTPIDTGHLRESWKVRPVIHVVGPTGEVIYQSGTFTDVDYAEYVEYGTGLWGPKHAKYLIVPKTPDGVLHWVAPDGSDVFAKFVWHPGSPGAHMVAKAAADCFAAFHLICEPALLEWKAEVESITDRGGAHTP